MTRQLCLLTEHVLVWLVCCAVIVGVNCGWCGRMQLYARVAWENIVHALHAVTLGLAADDLRCASNSDTRQCLINLPLTHTPPPCYTATATTMWLCYPSWSGASKQLSDQEAACARPPVEYPLGAPALMHGSRTHWD